MNLLHFLLLTGGVCITIALIEAWLMVAARFWRVAAIKNRLTGYGFMVKSHVDYLMMATLLFSIYAVFASLAVQLSPVFVVSMCIGALLNPFGFLVAALGIGPSRFMTVLTHVSFVLTTLGFMGAVGTMLVHIL